MQAAFSFLGVVLWVFLSLPLPRAIGAVPLVDDRAITLTSPRAVAEKRKELIDYIWGKDGFPTRRQPESVRTNVATPVQHLTNVSRVDELRMELAPGLQALAYHFIPEHPNGALVVVHHGHACTLDDDPAPTDVGYGLQRTIRALLADGYGVLGVFMPHMRPGDCTGQHDTMFQLKTAGSPMKFFLEPVALSLNYLKQRHQKDRFPKYRSFHMTGLSGGGWTTTVYAAVDPTICSSYPVAGTIPLYLRTGGSVGDREQFEPTFYGLAGYLDLYILGASGRTPASSFGLRRGQARKQVQILVRRDDCCFGQAQHDPKVSGMPYAESMRSYETRVHDALTQLKEGAFRLELDETAPSHMISHHAIEDILLPELKSAR